MGKRNYNTPEVHVEEPEVVLPKVEEPEMVAAVEVEEVPPVVTGTVTDCTKLNVRRAPSLKATVVCEISRNETVTVDEGKSNAEWYSVCTESGATGFCMKKYITISQ